MSAPEFVWPDAWKRAVERARVRAEERARPQWLALQRELPPAEVPDPLTLFERGGAEKVYWEQPETGRWIVGWGAATSFEVHGAARFEVLADSIDDWFGGLDREDLEDACHGPFALGGLAFASERGADPLWRDFPPGRFAVPALCWSSANGRCFETHVLRVGARARLEDFTAGLFAAEGRHRVVPRAAAQPEDARGPRYWVQADRPHEAYCDRVRLALDDIAQGTLEKVVVARSLSVGTDADFTVPSFLATLRASQPSCTSFAFARGSSIFVGATPEPLLSLQGDALSTAAIAGTAPRGRNPEEEQQLGRALRESKKEQAEHEVVVRTLREALEPVCDSLEGAESPDLLRLEGLQHLHTPLHGRLREDVREPHLLRIAARLHPTPAVGGAPVAEAIDWIERNEGLDRGWYAGPIGFVDATGCGELRVALRCALVRGRDARLYAGAGIVAGSEPEAELRETRLKLRAALAPLTEI